MSSELTNIRLREINFLNPEEIAARIAALQKSVFPEMDTGYIPARFNNVEAMFEGRYPGYLPMDTAYHDIEHTMQATLCLFHLLANRQRSGALPALDEADFNVVLIAMLLHDIGYLKEKGDDEGTGAKYTHVHESRSCRHAREYLSRRSWPEDAIVAVEHLISSTGPRSDITKVRFASEKEKVLGQAVCTADFIGQMSDPRYVEKLPLLYQEFEESYDFQGLEGMDRPFTSYEDMLVKTPAFWEKFVHWKMTDQCSGVWQYFTDPDTGQNPYLDAVEENIAAVKALIAQLTVGMGSRAPF